MKGSLIRRRTPIGLDLSGRAIRAVQFSERMGKHRVEATLVLPRLNPEQPFDRSELEFLVGALDRHGFTGNEVVLSVPRGDLLQEISDFKDSATTEEVDTAFIEEFARAADCDPDRIEFSWWELPSDGKNANVITVLAAGCSHEDAEDLLAMFDDVGLDVIGIDLDSCALLRTFGKLITPPDDESTDMDNFGASVSLDWNSILISVFDKTTLVYQRATLDIGLNTIVHALETQAGVDPEFAEWLLFNHGFNGLPEEMECAVPPSILTPFASAFDVVINEIVMALSYVVRQFPDHPITRLNICGDAIAIPGLAERMTDLLQIQTAVTGLPELHACIESLDLDPASGQLATASGLALGAA